MGQSQVRRLELQDLLVETVESDHVYFQPPRNTSMQYPCIRYERNFIQADRADNRAYQLHDRYLVTVITRDPDSDWADKIAALPKVVYDRFYVADNLIHHVFKMFF